MSRAIEFDCHGMEVTLPDGAKLGITFDFLDGGLRITRVAQDSAMEAAGVTPGVTISAINGQSTRATDLDMLAGETIQTRLTGLIASIPSHKGAKILHLNMHVRY